MATALGAVVALRKESVDRNAEKMKVGGIDVSSLSARRAWIEITALAALNVAAMVALRKESVDRNACAAFRSISPRRRSPQGERG